MTEIGATLREARMREHRDIAEFEERTKIRAKYLRALEDEEWALLPGYTFAKAFLRTYADMLGLDGRLLVDEFKRQYQDPSEVELAPVLPARGEVRRARERAPEHGGDRERRRGRERRRAGPSSRVLAVALLVVALAATLFVVQQLRKSGNSTRTTTTSSSSTSHSRSAAQTTPARVALALVVSSPVRVCLIGYRTAHGGAHTRFRNALLTPSSPSPVLHADSHFLVSFTGGALRMMVDGHAVPVSAGRTTVAYEISLGGRYRRLAAASAPHCS